MTPVTPRPTAGATPFITDVAAWARQALDAIANEISSDDRALLESQVAALAKATPSATPPPPDPTAATVVRDINTLKKVAAQLKDAPEVAIDLETSSLDPRIGEIVGIGLSASNVNFYFPIAHRCEVRKSLLADQLPVDAVVKVLCLDRLPLIAHNAKFEFRWLRRHAGVTCKFIWDTMVAARLRASHLPADLKDLAMRELDVPDWSLDKAGIKNVQFLSIERVARYCAKDCRYTLELYRRQRECML
ncbi:MAG: hypothetical protein WCL32_06445 [Planctomycetota bacterium]